MKTCIACGMPMKTQSEFAMGDESKDYCVYCARPDGTMQSYEEKLESMTGFIIKTQGLEEEAAKSAAKGMLEKLPAWKK
ncbi:MULTISPECIES: zinc ribbon domain-containing protein [unclassified Clostridium]|uniref:zinc ribbon domain-containing protein n=1 Tax=unclassified Clostridium TaxID=2614128 RepID=UPI001EEC8D8A|nr:MULTISPECIES: zinc ribbon domain-containing protein [unclassified Clostridium]MDD7794331.1 zinc ribbon domain-containing protein [Clostridium sp. 'White wine YQ']